jgi:hypothetical protein
MRNTQIEKALNRKMHPRYLGPLIVVTRNFGGAYVLCELDGSVLHHPIAAFRILPYLTQNSIPLPLSFIDIDGERLEELRTTTEINEDPNEQVPEPEIDTQKSFHLFLPFAHVHHSLSSLFSVLYKSQYRISMVAQTQQGFFGHDDLLSLSLIFIFRFFHFPSLLQFDPHTFAIV